MAFRLCFAPVDTRIRLVFALILAFVLVFGVDFYLRFGLVFDLGWGAGGLLICGGLDGSDSGFVPLELGQGDVAEVDRLAQGQKTKLRCFDDVKLCPLQRLRGRSRSSLAGKYQGKDQIKVIFHDVTD